MTSCARGLGLYSWTAEALGTVHYLLYRGGIEEKLEGPLNFFKPERRGLEKIQRDERRGALKRFTCLKKH